MTYNEEWILSQIRRQNELIVYLLSVIGNSGGGGGVANFIQYGTANPNDAAILPANLSIGGFYDQVDSDGDTVFLWIWVNNKWR